MVKINADIELCTGCQICALACSYEMTKAFNPRNSKIVVHQDLNGMTRDIEFIDNCNVKILTACRGATGDPPCISLCCAAALQIKTGE